MKKPLVLVIDDDQWYAEHCMGILEKAGFRTRHARHALEAITLMDGEAPSALLLDIMLPGSNGIALLNETHSHADLAQIPVVIMSASQVPGRSFEPYGVIGVIDKNTTTPDAVVATIRRALG